MARFVRECTQCGSVDQRTTWTSLDDATKQGAFEQKWTCSGCAWTEFDVVDADEGRTRQEADSLRR